MKKRILSLICVLALVLGVMVFSVNRAEAVTDTTCECGATNVEWTTLTADTTLEPGGHYRLEGTVTKRISYTVEGTVCIDLAGQTLKSSSRSILLGDKSVKAASILNIMDSSAKQTGVIQGEGGPSYAGGICYTYAGSTLNMYGGTMECSTTNVCAYSGGIVCTYGTFNLYGGKIIGGVLGGTSTQSHIGATAVVQSGGAFNCYGGSVISGTAESDALGHCVYVKDGGSVILSGNASVDEIAMTTLTGTTVKISGKYTGKVAFRSSKMALGAAIASLIDNADVSGATISISDFDAAAGVSGNSLVAGEGRYCEACQKQFVWQTLSDELPASASGHYYLTKDVSAGQVTLKSGATICLDLAGYTYKSSGRAFILGVNGGTNGEVLNIMDSSEGKTGALKGQGGSSSYAAGVIYAYVKTSINIYGGTIAAEPTGSAIIAKNGGVLDSYGNINMYDGKLVGCHVAGNGGAVCLLSSSSVFNMEGGQIISGTADGKGKCVYLPEGATMKLSGNASPEQIYFNASSAAKLIVSGDYTGKTELAFTTIPALGADIGNANNATVALNSITLVGSRYVAAVSGSDLLLTEMVGAAVVDQDGKTTCYDTLAAALAAWDNNSAVIKLLADNAEDVTVSGTVTLDLYGWDMTGAITVNGTLYCMDSCTDDGTVKDVEGYGLITGTVTGEVTYAEGYMPLQETDGTSYHKYILKLTKVNLRPGNTGLYFTGDILLDEAVQGKLARYGIAVSTQTKTPSADPADATSLYTAYTREQYGTADAASVLIRNIMDGEASDGVNAATTIYACPYVCFEDGTYFYGNVAGANMRQVTELADKQVSSLKLPQFRAVSELYKTYKATLSGWNVPNLISNEKAAEKAANDRVLKVLVIGNSHGLDSTNLLYEVFKTEGLPAEYDNLILGAIYTGGCSVSTHAKNALGGGTYEYWKKNDGSDINGAWQTFDDPTMHEVLINEDWDVVLLQEMNTSSARSEYFENSNIETVFTVVTTTLGYEPEFMWNMIWANPEIPESYINHLYQNGDDGSGGNVGSGSEGDDNDTSDAATIAKRLAWIFQTQRPSAVELWGKNYYKLWENNRQVMYNNIVSNVHNYVVGKDVHNIGMDDVMVNATAIQYAIEWMGMPEQDMYRDYTHVSDLGRLVVSYLWYAKLTGKTSIGDPNYTVLSQALENARQPLGYTKDFSVYSDVIKNAVNFALADPYGVIQNYTYAEYLALTPEKQAAYEASFEKFSVHSGWTFEKWLAQAVAGVTYTDYAGMTDEQKAAFQALCADFDSWYAGVVENLRYAEYFLLTDDQKAAYEALRGDSFSTWLAEAKAGITYTDYVGFIYEEQQAFKASFADPAEFDALYASWLANMTYEEFMALPMHQKLQYKKTYSSTDKFLEWYYAAKSKGNVLNGKKIIFFGNSHTYYGRVVSDQAQDTTHEKRIHDKGVFYEFCKANGIDVDITNYVFGTHELADFYSGSCAAGKHDGHNHFADIPDFNYDYLILQQGTSDNENDLVGDVQKMIAPFKAANPDVKVVFLAHLRAYTDDYAWLAKLKDLENMGVTVVDWGGMLDGILEGTLTVPGSRETYNKNTFIIGRTATDGYHPNLLVGNIVTQMLYSVLTGEKAAGKAHNMGSDSTYHNENYVAKFRSTYYVYSPETNFDAILASEGEMLRLQNLMDRWLAEKSYREY